MEKEKTMKKNDWLLLFVILLTAALIFFIRYFVGDEHPGYVTVRVGGEITETYDSVSYTHLDVYKRQVMYIVIGAGLVFSGATDLVLTILISRQIHQFFTAVEEHREDSIAEVLDDSDGDTEV